TATSTASASRRASRPANFLLISAMRSEALPMTAARRRSIFALASASPCATPRRKASASAASMVARECAPRVNSSSKRNFTGSAWPALRGSGLLMIAIRPSINQFVVGAAGALGDDDVAFGGQFFCEIDHGHLRLVDLAQADRAHALHFLVENLGGARGHVALEEVARGFRRALKGDGELVAVEVAQDRLDGGGVELDEIVEGEHQRLDALGGFAVLFFERADEAGLRLAIEIIEDFGNQLVGVAAAGLRQVRHEFRAQRLLDTLQHVLLDCLHAQHAVDDV